MVTLRTSKVTLRMSKITWRTSKVTWRTSKVIWRTSKGFWESPKSFERPKKFQSFTKEFFSLFQSNWLWLDDEMRQVFLIKISSMHPDTQQISAFCVNEIFEYASDRFSTFFFHFYLKLNGLKREREKEFKEVWAKPCRKKFLIEFWWNFS